MALRDNETDVYRPADSIDYREWWRLKISTPKCGKHRLKACKSYGRFRSTYVYLKCRHCHFVARVHKDIFRELVRGGTIASPAP